ncbi:TerC family protein [Synechococcus sp.]
MEASSLDSLTPLITAADQWHEVLLLLPVLVGLEVVLSADNAIALAAIAKGLKSQNQQKQALNLGLVFALFFRISLILVSRWVLGFKPLMAAGAAYLLWLCADHFINNSSQVELPEPELSTPELLSSELTSSKLLDSKSLENKSINESLKNSANVISADNLFGFDRKLAGTAISIALTDLAFSLDSVAAAVAVSDKLWLVITGGIIGVVALRLSSNLFIELLNNYPRLEAAGYIAVGLVGIQLLVRVFWPFIELPQWLLLSLVGLLFLWGFTNRRKLC